MHEVVSLQLLSQFATSMNLKYCINLFAHDPHMREPNSFATVDEFMSNLEPFLMERHFWRTPCRLF